MKISDSNLNAVTTSSQGTAATSAGDAAARGKAAGRSDHSRSDRVQISDLSSTLKALSAGSPERQANVSRLSAAYQNGSYRVNAHAVGQSLIADALTQ